MLFVMSSNRQRRLRGTGKATVALNVHIEPVAKAKIDAIADALGRSQGQVLDLVISHAQLPAPPRVPQGGSPPGPALSTQGRRRRTRGTGKATVALNVHIEAVAKSKIDAAADQLGRSQGQVLDLVLDNTDVDAHGRPDFWDGPLATDFQSELPLASTA